MTLIVRIIVNISEICTLQAALTEEDELYTRAAMADWLYVDTTGPGEAKLLVLDPVTRQFVPKHNWCYCFIYIVNFMKYLIFIYYVNTFRVSWYPWWCCKRIVSIWPTPRYIFNLVFMNVRIDVNPMFHQIWVAGWILPHFWCKNNFCANQCSLCVSTYLTGRIDFVVIIY